MAFVLALKTGRIRVLRITNQGDRGLEKHKQSQAASQAREINRILWSRAEVPNLQATDQYQSVAC